MKNNKHSSLPGSMARLSLVVVLMGLIALSLAACGGDAATPTATGGATGGGAIGAAPTESSSGSGTSSGAAAQEVKSSLNEWSVSLNVDQVTAGKVKFIVSNQGQFGHNFVVLDPSGAEMGETPVFKKDDGTKELEVEFAPGTYKLVCDVPGHTEKGMQTSLTVK